jgi:DNA-binding NtrC family response regulator
MNPPPMPANPGEGLDLSGLIESIERYYISMALGQASGNRTRAAERLGMKRTTLLARMRSLGMRPGSDGE